MVHRWTDLPRPHQGTERRSWRRSYIMANAFEFAIASSAIAAALNFYVHPEALEAAVIGRLLGPLAYGWNTGYLIGGVLVVYGLTRPSSRSELAGLSVLSSAIIINGIAALAAVGSQGAASALFYFSFGLASAIRAYIVLRLMRIGGASNRE